MNARVAEMAKLQRTVGAASDAAWAGATASAIAYERTVKSAAKAQEHLGSTTTRAGAAMGKMAVHAKAVRDHIFGAVRFLAKFSAFSVAGGLIGAGGLAFGLDDLAGRVLATQRTSRGLGLTSGQYNSFMANARQYAGGGVLAAAANAQLDPRAWGQLGAMGVSTLGIGGRNATQIAGQEIMAIHRDYARNPNVASAWWAAARSQGFSDSEIRNIGTARTSSLVAMNRAVGQDAAGMGFSAKVAREWAAFDIQLSKATTQIGSAFVTALAPLTPQLTQLSKEFADFIVGAEKSGKIKEWIGDVESGLKEFNAWLQSPAFRADMKTFAAAIAQLARETVHALRWMGLIAPASVATPAASALSDVRTPSGKNIVGLAQYWNSVGGVPASGIDDATKKYAAASGVPLAFLRAQAHQESGYGTNLYNPKSGIVGVMQIASSNYKKLGITNPLSTSQEVRGAAAMDAALFKKYGSWKRVAAAYDWGQGNLDADIAAHGKDWLRFAPKETQDYIASKYMPWYAAPAAKPAPHDPAAPAITKLIRAIHARHAQKSVHVTVHSPPGSRVFVGANGAAGGSGGGGM